MRPYATSVYRLKLLVNAARTGVRDSCGRRALSGLLLLPFGHQIRGEPYSQPQLEQTLAPRPANRPVEQIAIQRQAPLSKIARLSRHYLGQTRSLLADPVREINNNTRHCTLPAHLHSRAKKPPRWHHVRGASKPTCLPCTPRRVEIPIRRGRSAIRAFGAGGHARRHYLPQPFLLARGA